MRFRCNCGEIMWDEHPGVISYLVGRGELDQACNKRDDNSIEYGALIDISHVIWKCPICQSLYIVDRENGQYARYEKVE